MSSLERAKRFLAQKGTKLGLATVPLAVAALHTTPAHAGTVFVPGGCSIYLYGGSGVCSDVQAGATGGNASANWIQLWSTAITPDPSGSITLGVTNRSASGSGFGAGDSVPVSWDLQTTGSGTYNWTLLFQINGSSSSPSYSTSGAGTAGGPDVTGSGAINILSSTGAPTSYTITLNVFGDVASLTLPSASGLNLNPAGGAVPEPGSGVLAGLGMAAAWLFRRRRKA